LNDENKALNNEKEGRDQTKESSKTEKGDEAGDEAEGMGGSAKRPRLNPRDEVPSSLEFLASCAAPSVVLEEITREHRDRKAVKPNDADVPEYMWESHLVERFDGQDWNEENTFESATLVGMVTFSDATLVEEKGDGVVRVSGENQIQFSGSNGHHILV
jgi:hypothetical protein